MVYFIPVLKYLQKIIFYYAKGYSKILEKIFDSSLFCTKVLFSTLSARCTHFASLFCAVAPDQFITVSLESLKYGPLLHQLKNSVFDHYIWKL